MNLNRMAGFMINGRKNSRPIKKYDLMSGLALFFSFCCCFAALYNLGSWFDSNLDILSDVNSICSSSF